MVLFGGVWPTSLLMPQTGVCILFIQLPNLIIMSHYDNQDLWAYSTSDKYSTDIALYSIALSDLQFTVQKKMKNNAAEAYNTTFFFLVKIWWLSCIMGNVGDITHNGFNHWQIGQRFRCVMLIVYTSSMSAPLIFSDPSWVRESLELRLFSWGLCLTVRPYILVRTAKVLYVVICWYNPLHALILCENVSERPTVLW